MLEEPRVKKKHKLKYSENVRAIYVFLETRKMLTELTEKYPDIKITYFTDRAVKDAIEIEYLKRKAEENERGITEKRTIENTTP